MSTLPRARIRIAADIFQFDDFEDLLRENISGYIPKLRAGDDVQFEIALLNNGELMTDLSGISTLHLEIKPLNAVVQPDFNPDDYEDYDLRGPAADVSPIREKIIAGTELNDTITPTQWDSAEPDLAHAIITLDSSETHLAPGDRWLTLAITTTDTPAQTRTIAAGRIRILGGGRNQGSPAPSASQSYYSAEQSDQRFLKISSNLADLDSTANARNHLDLGSAALLDSIDEDDFASQSNIHLPTQQSVKAYVDRESLLHEAMRPCWHVPLKNHDGVWTTGSAYLSNNSQNVRLGSGGTANSTVNARYGASNALSGFGKIQGNNGMPWGTNGCIAFSLHIADITANSVIDISFGHIVTDSDASPLATDQLVGFQIQNLSQYGVCANSTTLTLEDLDFTLLADRNYRFVATWDAAGNVTWHHVNESYQLIELGNSSAGPITGGSVNNALMLGATNGTDSAPMLADMAAIIVKL